MTNEIDQQIMVASAKQLKKILDDLLAVGDWNSSLFLQTSAAKLKKLRDNIEELCCDAEMTNETAGIINVVNTGELLSGCSKAFILMYQVDGANLQGWSRTIRTLVEYGVTRPVYKDENHIKEFVRSRVANIECHGYVIVYIKDEAFRQVDQQVDTLGHQLVALTEDAIKLENIVEFVHANKKRYAVRESELVLLGEI